MRLPSRVPLSVGEPASPLKDAVMSCRCKSVNVDPTLLWLRVTRRVLALRADDLAAHIEAGNYIAIEFAVSRAPVEFR